MRRDQLIVLAILLVMGLAPSTGARAEVTLFDYTSPMADQEGDYVASSGARLDGGFGLLALTGDPDWYYEDYAYRKALTITSSATISGTRFTIPLDGAAPELFDLALVDGTDIRLVDPSGVLVDPWWVELYGRIQREGDMRVVASTVPAGSSLWWIYFGGTSTGGDRTGVFTHPAPAGFYLPGSDEACASSDLRVMSFVGGNTVEWPGSSITLEVGEWTSISAGTLSPETLVSATGPVYAAFDTVGDAAAPLRLAGTNFVYPTPRYAEHFTVVSPDADASVMIIGLAGVLDSFTVLAGTSASRDVDLPDGEAVHIASDVPVLVARHSVSTAIYDYMVMSPPSTDVTGPILGRAIVVALEDSTSGTAWLSDSTSESFSLDALGTYTITVTGSQGSGPAARIVADRPVMAISYADGDGGDMVTYLPTRWLGTEFVLPFDAQYAFVSAPHPGTQCTLEHGGGSSTRTADTLAPPYAKRLYWGSATNGANLLAPIVLTCDAPVHASAERTTNDDEVNLWPFRFFRSIDPGLGFEWAAGVQTRHVSSRETVDTPLFRAPLGVVEWQDFEEGGGTAAPGSTTLGYLLSTDGGSTWLTHDADGWVESAGLAPAMDAAEVAEEIAALPTLTGTLMVRAVLESADGVETPRLDEIRVTYEPPGPLDHLEFGPVPAVVTAGVSVEVTITARDADSNLVTGFADSALLFTEPSTVTLVPSTTPDFTAGTVTFDLEFHGEDTVTLVALSGDARGEAGPILVMEGAGDPAVLEKYGGDEQFGPAGTTLSDPIEVRVLDAEGVGVAGAAVDFEVTAGGGDIVPSNSYTGADGVASAHWTLGPSPGANRAQADAGDIVGSPATFVARGDPDDSDGAGGNGACGCILVY